MFDNEHLKIFKDMHDKYGAKVQLNLFYQKMMTLSGFCLRNTYKDLCKTANKAPIHPDN